MSDKLHTAEQNNRTALNRIYAAVKETREWFDKLVVYKCCRQPCSDVTKHALCIDPYEPFSANSRRHSSSSSTQLATFADSKTSNRKACPMRFNRYNADNPMPLRTRYERRITRCQTPRQNLNKLKPKRLCSVAHSTRKILSSSIKPTVNRPNSS
jgi:hypothetical protein